MQCIEVTHASLHAANHARTMAATTFIVMFGCGKKYFW
jgi:hypothetical protein